jgi:hypothetical protein
VGQELESSVLSENVSVSLVLVELVVVGLETVSGLLDVQQVLEMLVLGYLVRIGLAQMDMMEVGLAFSD